MATAKEIPLKSEYWEPTATPVKRIKMFKTPKSKKVLRAPIAKNLAICNKTGIQRANIEATHNAKLAKIKKPKIIKIALPALTPSENNLIFFKIGSENNPNKIPIIETRK